MPLLPKSVNRLFTICAGIGENMVDFIFCDTVPYFRQLRHVREVFMTGQLQFVQAVHQFGGTVITKTQNMGVFPPRNHKLPVFLNHRVAGVRLFQKLCDLLYLTVKRLANIAVQNCGKITVSLCLVRQVAGQIQQGFRQFPPLKAGGLGNLHIGCKTALFQQFTDALCRVHPGNDLRVRCVFRIVTPGKVNPILRVPGRQCSRPGFNTVTAVVHGFQNICVVHGVYGKRCDDFHAGVFRVAANTQDMVDFVLGNAESGGRFINALRFLDAFYLLLFRWEKVELTELVLLAYA